jgi:photosynthetic reaction center cytochrome c subunit
MNNLVHSAGSLVYKCAIQGSQNQNSRRTSKLENSEVQICGPKKLHREDGQTVMKTNLRLRGFSRILMILAIIAGALVVNSPNLDAQAPAAGGPPAPPLTAAAMKGKTAGEFYKNVKVLKDIPAAKLHNAMEYINGALGVGCAYCHTIGKFDKDNKREKNVARSMMKMTFALDATVFDGKREVTCFTCHRGVSKAASTLQFPGEKSPTEPTAAEILPPLAVRDITSLDSSMSPSKAPATVESGPPAAPKPAAAAPPSLPPVTEIFSKYVQALGGNAAIGKVTSLVEKGTVEMLVPPPPGPPGVPPGPPTMGTVPAEIDRKLPGKFVVTVEFPGREPDREGFDGIVGWVGPREITGDELVLRQEFAEFPPVLKFRENHSKVQVDAIEKMGDRDAYRVVGTRLDGSAIDRLYFDAQTGLLLRSYTTMQSVLGSYPEETNYDDYRVVSGLQVPFTMVVLSPEGKRTYKWSQVEVNARVEDSRFAKPLPPPPPPKPAMD